MGHTSFLKQPELENVERSYRILIFSLRRQSRIVSWADPRWASGASCALLRSSGEAIALLTLQVHLPTAAGNVVSHPISLWIPRPCSPFIPRPASLVALVEWVATYTADDALC